MRLRAQVSCRGGVILPYIAVSLVALLGFIALAIDLGLVMVAKTQTQNAADAAAFAGARTLTGAASANTTQATANGLTAAGANTVVGTSVPAANVTMTLGAYHYDSNSQTFYPQFPPVSPDNYNLAQATISQGNPTFFAAVFGISSFNVTATAVAAHRPRDTTIVLDYSGSMNNESDLWNCETYQGSYQNTSNNTDTVFPQWGVYNTTFSPLCVLQCTASSDLVGYCNITQAIGGCGPMVNDYYQNARDAATAVQAFAPATTWPAVTNVAAVTLSSTQPSGDQGQTTMTDPTGATYTYGQTISNALSGRTAGKTVLAVNDLIPKNYGSGTSAAPYNGSKLWAPNPNGYTIGPNYWGMTFFTWPPDPSVNTSTGASNDWRQLYFLSSNGTPWYNSLASNTTATSTSSSSHPSAYPSDSILFAGGTFNPNAPTGNYQINYKAILAWINANCVQQTAGDGHPFPTMLRSSNQLFYSYIPTDVPSSAYTWANANSNISGPGTTASGVADPSVRFWKEYIDFVIGVWQDPSGNIQTPANPSCSYGGDFTPGTSSAGSGISISGPDATVYLNGLVDHNQRRRRLYLGAHRHLQHTHRHLAFHRHRDRHYFRREGHRHHRYQPRLRIYDDANHHAHRRGLYHESHRRFANVHLHEPHGQPQAPAAPLLVRSHDHDPVHVGHRDFSRRYHRCFDAARQAGHPGGVDRYPEQPPQRPGVDAHVQPAALQRRGDRAGTVHLSGDQS